VPLPSSSGRSLVREPGRHRLVGDDGKQQRL
jgi:hypothetical protein